MVGLCRPSQRRLLERHRLVNATRGISKTHTVVAGGMPGWQLAVIVAVAALLAATIAVFVYRARTAQRSRPVPATYTSP